MSSHRSGEIEVHPRMSHDRNVWKAKILSLSTLSSTLPLLQTRTSPQDDADATIPKSNPRNIARGVIPLLIIWRPPDVGSNATPLPAARGRDSSHRGCQVSFSVYGQPHLVDDSRLSSRSASAPFSSRAQCLASRR